MPLPEFIVVSYTLYIEPSDEPNGMLANEGDLPIIHFVVQVMDITEGELLCIIPIHQYQMS